MHGSAPYDPVKAHEYYMRTRKLKGRKKAAPQPTTITKTAWGRKTTFDTKPPKPGTYRVTMANGKTYDLSPQQLKEQKAYADKRVGEIKQKLGELNKKLKEKMAKAKKAQADAKKPPTAADKAKAARESKKYRQAHKQELATKAKRAASKAKASTTASTPHKADPVTELHATIAKVKGQLDAAVKAQRALSSATKNG